MQIAGYLNGKSMGSAEPKVVIFYDSWPVRTPGYGIGTFNAILSICRSSFFRVIHHEVGATSNSKGLGFGKAVMQV